MIKQLYLFILKVIGKVFVLHEGEDDLGLGDEDDSKVSIRLKSFVTTYFISINNGDILTILHFIMPYFIRLQDMREEKWLVV